MNPNAYCKADGRLHDWVRFADPICNYKCRKCGTKVVEVIKP